MIRWFWLQRIRLSNWQKLKACELAPDPLMAKIISREKHARTSQKCVCPTSLIDSSDKQLIMVRTPRLQISFVLDYSNREMYLVMSIARLKPVKF